MTVHDIIMAANIAAGKAKSGTYTKSQIDEKLSAKLDVSDIDDELNDLSTDPVQNKVVAKKLKEIDDFINSVSIVYGIEIDRSESDPTAAVTYLKDAVGMTPAKMGASTFSYGSWGDAFFMPRPCMLKYDGTVDYYLSSDDYSKKEDGTASDIDNPAYGGNAMMEFGLLYYKLESDTVNGKDRFFVSNRKIDGTYNCWCNYDSDNNITDHFYVSIYNGTSAPVYSAESTYALNAVVRYNGADYICTTAVETAEAFDSEKWMLLSSTTRMRSLSGIQTNPANGNCQTSGEEEIARALANNTHANPEWYIRLWADRTLLTGLLYLMSKSLDLQGTFGRGIDSGSQTSKEAYITGTLDDKGLFYGSTANGSTPVKVFGIENFWAHSWDRTAGLIGTTAGIAYKLTHGTADGSTATTFNTSGSGYNSFAFTKPAANYVKAEEFGKHGMIPVATGNGADSAHYWCDYWYPGNGFALVGGSSYYSLTCGFFVTLSNGVSNRAWSFGGSLSCKPLARRGE